MQSGIFLSTSNALNVLCRHNMNIDNDQVMTCLNEGLVPDGDCMNDVISSLRSIAECGMENQVFTNNLLTGLMLIAHGAEVNQCSIEAEDVDEYARDRSHGAVDFFSFIKYLQKCSRVEQKEIQLSLYNALVSHKLNCVDKSKAETFLLCLNDVYPKSHYLYQPKPIRKMMTDFLGQGVIKPEMKRYGELASLINTTLRLSIEKNSFTF